MKAFYIGALFLALIIIHAQQAARAVEPWQIEETRLCGPPKRDAAGRIYRSAAVRDAFLRMVYCPSTKVFGGTSCPGHQVDHIRPLADCGCDSVTNMQLLPNAIKTCAASTGLPCKDRIERQVYGDGCRIWEAQQSFRRAP